MKKRPLSGRGAQAIAAPPPLLSACGCGCAGDGETHLGLAAVVGAKEGGASSSGSARFAAAVEACRRAGLRKTAARDAILAHLDRRGVPVTLSSVAEAPGIGGKCDPATVFRVLQKLEEIGVVRRIWLHDRTPYYVLAEAGRHSDYVLCVGCGKVEPTGLECPGRAMEEAVASRLGYASVRHELDFYGLCPACQSASAKARA